MVNEIALGLLYGLLGWKVAAIYMGTGLFVAIGAGWIIGRMGLENHIEDWVTAVKVQAGEVEEEQLTWSDRFVYGWDTVKEIIEQYKKTSDSLIDQLDKHFKDEDLQIEDDMYGEKWKKGLTLLYLLLHHIHHRGQMTILMRQAGVKVIGVYGPAKEEWSAFGMETEK
jgi:uncharacterized damage-inducible protein DinB